MDPNEIKKQLTFSYEELTQFLQEKYGKAEYDYFNSESCSSVNRRVSRSSEGLFCHHIDENKAAQLSTIQCAKRNPFSYQQADRLVYCNILEHLILHIKIVEEPRHPDANPKERLGIIGITDYLCPIINDFYGGYVTEREYLIQAFELVKDNFDDYIFVLRFLLNIFRKRINRLPYGTADTISKGMYTKKSERIYDLLIRPNDDELMPESELKALKEKATNGEAIAQKSLAKIYESGVCVMLDIEEAYHWFELYALQSDNNAQLELAKFCETHFRGDYEDDRFFKWYKIAADNGNIEASKKVAYCFLKGYGVEKNVLEALSRYRTLAEAGDLPSILILANNQENTVDRATWYLRAVELGDVQSLVSLGDFYIQSEKKNKNLQKAIEYYELACSHNLISGFTRLGDIYYFGKLVQRDYVKARSYYEKAIGLSSDDYNQDYKDRLKRIERKISPCVRPNIITVDTLIERGFVATKLHREFFKSQIDDRFTFNIDFHNWLRNNPGKTYGDAVNKYYKIQARKR